MVFIRPTFEVPNCASGMLASPRSRWACSSPTAVRHPNGGTRIGGYRTRYCSNSHVSPNGGVTSSISDSEKSVVMFSLVSGAPSTLGMPRLHDLARGETRKTPFSTPLRPPRNTPFAGIDEPREAALEFLVDHVTQYQISAI
jgi:hypothetical protein